MLATMDGEEPPTIAEAEEEGEDAQPTEGEGDTEADPDQIPEAVAPEEPLSQLKEEPEEEEAEVPVEPVDSLASTIPPEPEREWKRRLHVVR